MLKTEFDWELFRLSPGKYKIFDGQQLVPSMKKINRSALKLAEHSWHKKIAVTLHSSLLHLIKNSYLIFYIL